MVFGGEQVNRITGPLQHMNEDMQDRGGTCGGNYGSPVELGEQRRNKDKIAKVTFNHALQLVDMQTDKHHQDNCRANG